MTARNTVLTIGHSNHALETFVDLLRRHEVTAIADVRSAPFSRYTPHFNRDALERALKPLGIQYVFLGQELGARSPDPACYENGKVRYARLARAPVFQSGIERVIAGAERFRIALMCAEKEPLECHRTLLVARTLHERGVEVSHILASGAREEHRETMLRLLDLVDVPRADLFRTHDELVSEALSRQEERIAYADDRMAGATRGEHE